MKSSSVIHGPGNGKCTKLSLTSFNVIKTERKYFTLSISIFITFHNFMIRSVYDFASVSNMIVVMLLFGIPSASTQRTHRLFWDDKNPVFNPGNNRMFVEEGDDITIVCPSNSPEHNNIYWSKKNEVFDLCEPTFDSNSVMMIHCEPYSIKEFNFQVTKFSWVSLNPSFLRNKPIYLLSSPKVCKNYNMKIAIILKTFEKEKVGILKGAASPERVVQQKNSAPVPLLSLALTISLFKWSLFY